MFKDKINSIKALVKTDSKEGNANKKKIENLVVFLVLLIITIIAINIILGDNNNKTTKNDTNTQETSYKQLANENINNLSNNSDNSEYNLEKELEETLSKISGVGQVKVLLTYSETSETIPMYNEKTTESTTKETDTNGGVRTIQQLDSSKEVVYQEETNGKSPITKKIVLPKIEGAIVIAEGANNTSVKLNIIDAVGAVTGLPTHKVQVFKMK